MNRFLFSFIFFQITFLVSAQTPPKVSKKYQSTDQAGSENGPSLYNTEAKYKHIKQSSMYLTMRDGIKIAVNVSLPSNLNEGEKIPAIMYQTRYWRGAQFNWPFNAFLNNFSGKAGKMMKEVILRGYALIAVDSRGSGASMGSCLHPWTEDEVKDGYEITDWVVKQAWCNGKVGSAGISYSGTTAEFLGSTGHPAIKAIAPMFALFDVYDDISVPGGVKLSYFTSNWGKANTALDNNKLPGKDRMSNMIVAGVQPVKGERKMIKEAVKQHQANLSVAESVKSITYRDDISEADHKTNPDKFSPHTKAAILDQNQVAVYNVSGFFDGDYQHAAIKRFLTLKNPANKLIIGPWEHGGWLNCSSFNPGPSGFNKASELLKFFDYHLKGIDNGIQNEPRIHYYTIGEEKWKSSKVWPPENSKYVSFYLNQNQSLSENMPLAKNDFTPYQVDTSFGTGIYSRWRTLMGDLKTPYVYFDWQEKSKTLPHFTSNVLSENVEITGHPVVQLYVESNQTDGAFFVYLEDVDEKGNVHYVTEGQLRGLQRNISKEKRFYEDVKEIPNHSYLRKDGKELSPGKTELISFDLYPISYQFKKGHSIRISIAGADRDHFEAVNPGAKWKIQHNPEFNSCILLPIVK